MEENLKELELELLKMNIKRTQGLQPADAGKYRHLKKKIAVLKNQLRQEELKTPKKAVAEAANKPEKSAVKKVSKKPAHPENK